MPDRPGTSSRDLARPTGSGGAARAADVGASASTLDGDFADSAEGQWKTWDQIPVGVRVVLDRYGYSPAGPFLAGAIPPRTRRRGSDVFQRASAWAVDRHRLILLDGVRGLEGVGERRFRPNTPWHVTTRVLPYATEPRKRVGTVPVDAVPESGRPASSPDDAADLPDVIDVLPAPVRKQILTTVPSPEYEDEYLFQGMLKDFPRDHDAGILRVSRSVMIAVHATRSILLKPHRTPEAAAAALAATPWQVETLTAQLGDEEVAEITEYTENRAIAGRRPPVLPPAVEGRRQLR